jgi:carbonic anhydrase/acetyltransferase-like protein (isoleucine patch superfamily)
LIEDGALIGNGSVVLILARVGTGAIVGSNAVVTQRMHVPPGALAVGIPAKIRERAANRDHIAMAAQSYVDRVARYKSGLRLLT